MNYGKIVELDPQSSALNGWILTDDSSSQYLKPIQTDKFDCVEVRTQGNGKFAVVRKVVDLETVPREVLERIIESYYESVDEVFGLYGARGAAQIMAECLFEQLPSEEMDKSVFSLCELAAYEVVQKIIRS